RFLSSFLSSSLPLHPAIYSLSLHDALPIFTCIFQIQCEDRFLGKGRAVFPDLVDEVIFVNDFSVFLGCDGLVILSLTHGNYTSVDRKSTRLNSSHVSISYAVFCLNKKINLQ